MGFTVGFSYGAAVGRAFEVGYFESSLCSLFGVLNTIRYLLAMFGWDLDGSYNAVSWILNFIALIHVPTNCYHLRLLIRFRSPLDLSHFTRCSKTGGNVPAGICMQAIIAERSQPTKPHLRRFTELFARKIAFRGRSLRKGLEVLRRTAELLLSGLGASSYGFCRYTVILGQTNSVEL